MKKGVLVLCLVALAIFGCAAEAQVTPKPNIVFVLADDMRADDLAYMDRLGAWAQEGTRFEESAFHPTPQCCPARVTYLTGQYAHNHGVTRNPVGRLSGYDLFKRARVAESYLPRWLDEAGYATGVFGKFLNGAEDKRHLPGFDVAKMTTRPTQDAAAARMAEAFYRDNVADGKPVFAAVWLRSPHGPRDHPPEYAGDFDGLERNLTPSYDEADTSEKVGFLARLPRVGSAGEELERTWRTRLEMERRIEDAVLRMTQAAEEAGELDNTYFVVTTDNGAFLGEHRIRGGKALPYDASARTFFLFRGPNIVPQERGELVTDNDLAPTLMELAGVSVPTDHEVDGRSLVPLLHGENPATWRTATLIEHPAPPLYRKSKPGYKAVRTTNELYIEWETGHVEHYADEHQTEPSQDAEQRAQLDARLNALKGCTAETCRSAEGP